MEESHDELSSRNVTASTPKLIPIRPQGMIGPVQPIAIEKP